MVRPRGILNKNALKQMAAGSSGVLSFSAGHLGFGSGTVAQLQKNQALVHGAGRLQFAAGRVYLPSYNVTHGASVGSGVTVVHDGIYQVDGMVSCSGAAIEVFGGAVYVDSVAVSGTASFQSSDARGAAGVAIHGIAHARAGQVINVGVKSLHSTLITIGSEDLVHAPAATLRVVQLSAKELPVIK